MIEYDLEMYEQVIRTVDRSVCWDDFDEIS